MGKTIGAVAAVLALIASAVAVASAVGGRTDAARHSLRASTFSWLKPEVEPARWSASRLPGAGARLPVPPGWLGESGDPGTRTEVLRTHSGRIAGYLNATPRQGTETLGNWTEFRVDHNRDEGDREVRLLAAAEHLRFRSATGSCVLDTYRTESGSPYREIACIVAGRSATTVIVGAAPPGRWASEAPTIEQAIKSFAT